MELFTPAGKILETICSDMQPYTNYLVLPAQADKSNAHMMETIRLALAGITKQVAEHYKWGVNTHRLMNSHKLFVISEALQNAVAHGTQKDSSVTMGLFLGDLGVCYGFHDGGDYFKREEIKNIFENKLPIKEFGKRVEHLATHKQGVATIYDGTDVINVDTDQGVLYLVHLKESLDAKIK